MSRNAPASDISSKTSAAAGAARGGKAYLSGNEALAEGVRLSRPHVIAAYPITPQTTVVEKLSEMVEEGALKSEFLYVESEHSALSAAIGASSVGARPFTATSSQGLLYMAECLYYASGGRLPIVMMNANRSTALPWNIYGDQRDSLSQLDSGWLQIYAENAQESLDAVLEAYAVAEHPKVLSPVMINLDGFILTHTYELVEIPDQAQADRFLPPYETPYKMDPDNPVNMAFSAGPADNMEFKVRQHRAMQKAKAVIRDTDRRFREVFGRGCGGLTQSYRAEDADYLLLTLGSLTGLARDVTDTLREQGVKAGVLKLRYVRPFPEEDIVKAAACAKSIGVLEKDISFGMEGTVYTNVNSALYKAGITAPSFNFIGGLGGRDITKDELLQVFGILKAGAEEAPAVNQDRVHFIGLAVEDDERECSPDSPVSGDKASIKNPLSDREVKEND